MSGEQADEDAKDDAHAAVRRMLAARMPVAPAPESLRDDVEIGSEELGLDSIAVVEVLLECEERFGVEVVGLLERGPLRIGELARHLAAA